MAELPDLRPDCTGCIALCCVVFPFDVSAEFSFEKPAGGQCKHLDAAHQCTIHDDLESRGMCGCVMFDCLGAGQRLTQDIFPGQHWCDDEATKQRIVDGFRALRTVHSLIELLSLTQRLPLSREQDVARGTLLGELCPPDDWTTETLREFELSGLSQRTHAFLQSLRSQIAR